MRPLSVKRLLPTLGYRRQSNRKVNGGSKHRDRNAQFEHINAKAIAAGGAARHFGRHQEERADRQLQKRWHRLSPKGDPWRVKVHDFEDKELGKVVPYGVYDVGANAGWVSVGVTSDTAQFAVASIRALARRDGARALPESP